jgi:hypothetical protein
MYKDKEVPTLDGLKNKLIQRGFQFNYSTESLRIILQKLDFTYKKINKRSSIMETERLRVLRTQYINEIRRYRSENRNIVYIDETWYDTHDIVKMGWVDKTNKCILDTPPSRGKRVIILNAGGKNGWVPDCLLLSARNIVNSSVDYHQDMDANMFEKWFQEQLFMLMTKTILMKTIILSSCNNKIVFYRYLYFYLPLSVTSLPEANNANPKPTSDDRQSLAFMSRIIATP